MAKVSSHCKGGWFACRTDGSSDKGIILSLKAASTSLTQLQSPRPKSEQLQTDSITSQQPSQDRLEPAQESGPALDSGNSEVAPSFPTPTPISPAPTNSDIRTTESPAPSYLNPSPNPLQFPTRPEEVQIQETHLLLSNKRLT